MRKNPYHCDIRDKDILTIEQCAVLTGIGQSKLKALLDMPDCPFLLRNGRKRMVIKKAFLNYLQYKHEI